MRLALYGPSGGVFALAEGKIADLLQQLGLIFEAADIGQVHLLGVSADMVFAKHL